MVGLVLCLFIVAILSIGLVRAIDKMDKEYPDYKGEDFLSAHYETEYDYYKITENNSSKKQRQKKQVPQIKIKAK